MLIGGIQKTSLIDYPNKIAATIFLQGCNFRCPYCYNKQLVEKQAQIIKEEEILKILKSRKKYLDGVCITGGEPCMQKDLPSFINKIKKIGYSVKLDTNGANPEMLSELIKRKLVDYIAMDIKAPLEKYDSTTRVKTNINNIIKSIKLIKNSNIEYEFRTTVSPALLKKQDIIKMGELLKGSKRYFIQQLKIDVEFLDSQFPKQTYSEQELQSFSKLLKPYFDEIEIRM